MDIFFLPNERCIEWLARLGDEYKIFLPISVNGKVHWQPFDKAKLSLETIALREIRAAEPIKAFLFRPRESVATFPQPLEPAPAPPALLFGVKACDLRGLAAHQKMFLEGEYPDPFYAERLKNTVFVAADCPTPKESCFCNLVGVVPYATENADVSLTVLDEGWLLQPISERGRELIEKPGVTSADESQKARRESLRAEALKSLQRINPKPWNPLLPQMIAERTNDERFWSQAAQECVECFACLLNCPTCFCFLLFDQAKGEAVERTRIWDACYMAMYARVGGGANPRPKFLQRFINRFHCKFMNAKNLHGFYFCSGCGRCFTSCMGKIDIRDILGRL